MSRPATPTFATDGNYPGSGNPWNGQPIRVQPVNDYFSPNSAAVAEELNYELGSVCDSLAAVNGWAGVDPGVDWQPKIAATVTGYNGLTAIHWDPNLRQWLLGASVNTGLGACNVFTGIGVGDASDFVSAVDTGAGITLGGVLHDCCFDGTKYFAAVIEASNSSVNIYTCTPGSAWSLILTNADHAYSAVQFYQFGGATYFFANSSAGNELSYTTNSGGSWSEFSNGYNGTLWAHIADNGSQMVVMPQVGGSGSTYMVGSLASWTTEPLGTPGPFGAAQPCGLVYGADSAGPAFFCVTDNGSGTGMTTWRSADGLTWTKVSTIASFTAVRMAAVGSLLVAITQELSNGGSWALYSADGGATWHRSQGFLPTQQPGQLLPPKIAASDLGFAMLNLKAVRLSRLSGLSPALT